MFDLEIKIAKAVIKLKSCGIKPSQAKVIKLIGGSYSTIGPIFNSMKAQFADFAVTDEICKYYKLDKFNPNKLLSENLQLKKKLAHLEAVNFTFENERAENSAKLHNTKTELEHFKDLYQELKQERDTVLGQIKGEKDTQINSLLEELSAVHQQHSSSYRDFSYAKDEQLIQKEVTIINLKERIAALQAKLGQNQERILPQENSIQELKQQNLALVTKLHDLEQKLVE